MKVGHNPAAFKHQGNQNAQGPEQSRRPGSASHPGKHLGQIKKADQGLSQIDQNSLLTLLLSLLSQQNSQNQSVQIASGPQPDQNNATGTTNTTNNTAPANNNATANIATPPPPPPQINTNPTPAQPVIPSPNTGTGGIASGAVNNPLNLSAAEQNSLAQILALNTAPNNPQISQILDTNPSGRLDAGDTVVSQRPIDGNLTNKNHVLTNAQVSEFINQRTPSTPATATVDLSNAQLNLLRQDYQLRNVTIADSNNNGQLNAGDLLSGTRDPDPLRFFDETHVQFPITQEMVNKLLLT